MVILLLRSSGAKM